MTASLRVALPALAMLALAACAGAPPPPRAQAAAPAERGRELFLAECAGCHTLGAAGTPIAPDLSRVGWRLTAEEIERRLRDPRTHRPSARMPRIELGEAEIRALTAYLSELR
jgi:ubiquinol-cytochrome c reductase cytochrome c subunit